MKWREVEDKSGTRLTITTTIITHKHYGKLYIGHEWSHVVCVYIYILQTQTNRTIERTNQDTKNNKNGYD